MNQLLTGRVPYHPHTGFITTEYFHVSLGLRYMINTFYFTLAFAEGGLSDSRSGRFAPGKTALSINRVRD
jgi:hypothetical protein